MESLNTTFQEVENAKDPITLFQQWMTDAELSEPNDPNAVALATATRNGVPSVRMVLMKHADQRGFSFYTNAESRKGVELNENPYAAMCFHWKSSRRQIRIEGIVRELPAEEADIYFHSRGRRSQLGATVSRQSQPLESRSLLEQLVSEQEDKYLESSSLEIPRPDYWRGFVLQPERIEFWQDGANRLHDRMLFTRNSDRWEKVRLFP
jgi:pyridoxamine 5'-phosphate oxidase